MHLQRHPKLIEHLVRLLELVQQLHLRVDLRSQIFVDKNPKQELCQ